MGSREKGSKMQLQPAIGQGIFPGYAAALTLVKEHTVDGVQHAARATKATNGVDRLASALRSMTSFDHAIDNAGKLPLEILVRDSRRFLAGYDAARQAVMLLVQSGMVPGAREHVGRQALQAARAEFGESIRSNAADQTRFGGFLTTGWLEAAAEDASTGVVMLQRSPDLGRSLLQGLEQARHAASQGRVIDAAVVDNVTQLFTRADEQLTQLINVATARSGPIDDAAQAALFARVDALMARAAQV
jgi:hypothetical protein